MANKADSSVGALSCLIVAALFAAGFVHLAVSLRAVQVTDAADYNYASARQSIRRVQTVGLRGRILGRRGEVLAGNRPSLSIVCLPAGFEKRSWSNTVDAIERGIQEVGAVIGLKSPLAHRAISRHVSQSLAMPLTVWRDVGERELAVFCEHEREFPGFSVAETAERVYPGGRLASHVIGYVGRDRGESLAGDEKFSYFAPEMRGRSGLEEYYDGFLRGVPGERKLLVDARGFAIRGWTVVDAKPGPDLRTTIDPKVQEAAERELRGEKGACAVIDPRNGEVLALASSPGFDLNAFVPLLSPETYARYLDDPAKPLLNRATGGAYAPGSTFKPVMALAGLRAGYQPDETYECTGEFACGGMKLHCTSRWGHGPLDIRHALMRSCNPFFCNLGTFAGTNAFCSAARSFGLGAKTGIDLGVDRAGVVPDGEWKVRTYGERWYPGDLAQVSIGQGMLLATPLQMALVAGAVGTGRLVVPHLRVDAPVAAKQLPFSDGQLNVVREGLRMVVTGDDGSRGTGWRVEDGVSVHVSGKTGTAEVGAGEKKRKNAWFIAYAPSEAPTAAIALVVENGESGGGTAAPKVREILKAMFGGSGT
ncbi:MAG: penicillin-binding protein 2 [Kiritimatiellae bacterium]|nr:penicillin-binding protein 2 [Kiritimatiellia bacterium]